MHIPHVYIQQSTKDRLKERARIERRTLTAIVDPLIVAYLDAQDAEEQKPKKKVTKQEKEARARAEKEARAASKTAEACLEHA
jgi:hypothetical protein